MRKTLFLLISTILLGLVCRGQMDTILIDFGSNSNLSAAPWNNVTGVATGQIADMVNSYGFPTGSGVRVVDRFNAVSSYGTSVPNPSAGYPASATIDYFFGNSSEFGGLTLPVSSVELIGLNSSTLYTVEIFTSRLHSNNLETKYLIQGNSIDSLFLDVHINTGTVVSSTMYPDSNGIIKISVSPGPNNNNAYGFFYLGAVKLIYPHIPPSGPSTLKLVSPVGGEFWQVGKTPQIIWESQGVYDVVIEYTTGIGVSWILIDSVKAYQQPYYWTVPNTPSKFCIMRISSDTLADIRYPFEISTDTASCHVVVLGSSTAAGSGASPSDSSWVKRFSKALFQKNTRFSVTNLARGGYNTYHILPTGTPKPPNVTTEIDTARNVTKALSLNPYAIIVNMPSNDASNNFTPEQQLTNFDLISQAAANAGAKAWICTPQPRNFSNPQQIQIQRDVTDSILAIYGNYAIDFWNGMADTNGFILPIYNSGDGIHLNNQGHRELFQRVWASSIDTPGCAPYQGIIGLNAPAVTELIVYPNPFRERLSLKFESSSPGTVDLRLIDLHGRVIASETKEIYDTGEQIISWEHKLSQSNSSQVVCLVVYFRDRNSNLLFRQLVKLVMI